MIYRKLKIETLKELPIPMPPLAEQRRIVSEVERRLSIVEEIEATINTDLKRAERLRQAILQRAFTGKLVPQDPNDEPARVLLERIKAECERFNHEKEKSPPIARRKAQQALTL